MARHAKRRRSELEENMFSDQSGSDSEYEQLDDSGDDYSDDSKAFAMTRNKNLDKSKSGRMKGKKKPRVAEIKLPSRASVLVLAQLQESAGDHNLAHVDKSIITRIVKALNLANHQGTGEQEARAALRMANKLMSLHSVSQAAVLSTMDNAEDKLKKAGMSTVTVRCEEGKKMKLSMWSRTASFAMIHFFNCEYYTETFNHGGKNRIDFVFYGLAEQTVAAATAFEMVYNLIMTWRIQNKEAKGVNAKNAYCRGVADGLYSLAKHEKKMEEIEAAKNEQRRLEMAKKKEENERKKQIERLEQPKIKEEPVEVKVKLEECEGGIKTDRRAKVEDAEDEKPGFLAPKIEHGRGEVNSGLGDDDDDEDFSGDFMYPHDEAEDTHAEVDMGAYHLADDSDEDAVAPDFGNTDDALAFDLDAAAAKIETGRAKADMNTKGDRENAEEQKLEGVNEKGGSLWESAGQLVAFRDTAKTLANDFLKARKVKLAKSRKGTKLEFRDLSARQSYMKGKEDAKKIDVKRKRITDAEEDFVDQCHTVFL